MYHKYCHIFNFVFLYMPSAAKLFWYIINIAVFPFFLSVHFLPRTSTSSYTGLYLGPSVSTWMVWVFWPEILMRQYQFREYGAVGLKQALQNKELCWRACPVDPKHLCCSWAHKRSTYLWKTSRNYRGQDFPMPFSPDSWLKLITWLLFYTDIKFWYLFFFTNLCLIVLLLKGLHLFLSFTTVSVGSEKHFLSFLVCTIQCSVTAYIY